jgi:hypothetical protein
MVQVFGNNYKSCEVKKLRNLSLMIYFWIFENNYVVAILLHSQKNEVLKNTKLVLNPMTEKFKFRL